MSGLKAEDVVNAIEVTTSQYSRNLREFKFVQGYDSDNVSKKVVRIIMSYTDYVNRTVWFK